MLRRLSLSLALLLACHPLAEAARIVRCEPSNTTVANLASSCSDSQNTQPSWLTDNTYLINPTWVPSSIPSTYWKCADTDSSGTPDVALPMTESERIAVDAPTEEEADRAAWASELDLLNSEVPDQDSRWYALADAERKDVQKKLVRRERLQLLLDRTIPYPTSTDVETAPEFPPIPPIDPEDPDNSSTLTIALTRPIHGSLFYTGTELTFAASVVKGTGTITRVNFYNTTDGDVVAFATDAPYTAEYTATQAATVVFQASTSDNTDGEATSNSVRVTFGNLPTPPTAATSVDLNTVDIPTGLAYPVTSGVPLARGVATSKNQFTLKAASTIIPAQFDILATWPGGSIKSIGVSAIVTGGTDYTLEIHAAIDEERPPLQLNVPSNVDLVAVKSSTEYRIRSAGSDLDTLGPIRSHRWTRGQLTSTTGTKLWDYELRWFQYANSPITFGQATVANLFNEDAQAGFINGPVVTSADGLYLERRLQNVTRADLGFATEIAVDTVLTSPAVLLQTGMLHARPIDLRKTTFDAVSSGMSGGNKFTEKAPGWALASSTTTNLGMAIRWFSQMWPKGFQVKSDRVLLEFHPEAASGTQYRNPVSAEYRREINLYTKGTQSHTWDFMFVEGANTTTIQQYNNAFQGSPRLQASALYYAQTKVFGRLRPADNNSAGKDNNTLSTLEYSMQDNGPYGAHGNRDFGDPFRWQISAPAFHNGTHIGAVRHLYQYLRSIQEDYTTGTLSMTSGSATVTGSGTSWTNAHAGMRVFINDVERGIVKTVNSTTSITLASNASVSVSNSAYTLHRESERWWDIAEREVKHFQNLDVAHHNRFGYGFGWANNGPGEPMFFAHETRDHWWRNGHDDHFHLSALPDYYLLTGDPRTKQILFEQMGPWFKNFMNNVSVGGQRYKVLSPTLNTGNGGTERAKGWTLFVLNELYRVTNDQSYHNEAVEMMNHLISWWKSPTPFLRNATTVVTQPNYLQGTGMWLNNTSPGWAEDCGSLNGGGPLAPSNGPRAWFQFALLNAAIATLEADQADGGPHLLDRTVVLDMLAQVTNAVVQYEWVPTRTSFKYKDCVFGTDPAVTSERQFNDYMIFPLKYLSARISTLPNPQWYTTYLDGTWATIINAKTSSWRTNFGSSGDHDDRYPFYGYDDGLFPPDMQSELWGDP